MRVLTAASLICALCATAHAQDLPSRVRVLHPSCTGPITWPALEEALRVELRSMGADVDLDETGAVPARLVLDAACTSDATRIVVTLVHAPSGRSITEHIELGTEGDRVRVLAVGLSELVRSRWAALLVDPEPEPEPAPPPTPPVVARVEIDRDAIRAEVRRALAARDRARPAAEPAPRPGTFFDVALGVSAYPAATHATAELRAGASIPLGALARLALELTGGLGSAADPLGDVTLYGAGLAASLRAGVDQGPFPSSTIEAGPRVDVGWTHAEGVPASDAVRGAGLDALHLAVGLDMRLRALLTGHIWLLAGAEVGYSLVGIDARADERRITAQTGPRLALCLGASWH